MGAYGRLVNVNAIEQERSNNPTAVIREKRRLRTNLAKLSLELGNFRIARSSLFNRNFVIAEAERYF